MTTTRDILRLTRPSHWSKNVFVLMPLPHALASGGVFVPATFLPALAGFCLVNSAVYAFNDSVDAESDRHHPLKRGRPVAAGRISVAAARTVALVCLVAGLGLVALADAPGVAPLVGVYLAANLVYVLWGRSVALVDVALLASGYVVRVLLGCALVGVVASDWLLLCTTTLALFLSLAKRRADLVSGVEADHRPSLAGYTRRFLDHAMTVTSATAVVAYALYCLEAEVLRPGRELVSLPFVVIGVLEILRRVHVRGEGGSPVEMVLSSPVLLLCGAGWIGATLWSVAP